MPIDSSIYFKLRAPDVVGSIQQGMEFRQKQDLAAKQSQMMDEKAKREKQAYHRQEIGNAISALDSIQDKNIRAQKFPEIRSQLQQSGVDVNQIPEVYDDSFFNYAKNMYIGSEKLLNQEKAQAEIAKTKAETAKLYRDGKKPIETGENLPIDSKKMVETFATKNANKTGIKNQIDAVMENWDGLSEDQQLAAGRQLLKTLNSPEGADAIGAEEANRLGSKLEFAIGNFSNSNPTQFGRDLKGFKEQAMNTAKNLSDAVAKNQSEVDRLMGRPVAQKKKETPPGSDEKFLASISRLDFNKVPDDSLETLYKKAGGK